MFLFTAKKNTFSLITQAVSHVSDLCADKYLHLGVIDTTIHVYSLKISGL